MKLSTRFSLTMIGVSLITLFILVSLQQLIAQPQAESLGQDMGVSINELLASPLRSGSATRDELRTLQTNLDGLERGLQTAFADRDSFYRAQRRTFLLSTGLALLLATSFGLLAGRWLARPIEKIAGTARQVATGDLSARAAVQSRTYELYELTDTFNRMTETLQRLEEERKATFNDIAHDLRTPLTVIQARLDAFQDGVRPLTLENVLATQHAVDVMTRLITDLRTLALAEAGSLSLNKQPIDLCEIAKTVVADFEDKAKGKDVQLALHMAEAPTCIHADPDRLSQIVSNLLDNALKYTPRGGQIALYVLTAEENVQLIVRDSGEGLGEADLKRVMNRFYRADAAQESTSELGSSGLGLSIVNALTTLHGGTLEIANAKEGGAQFQIRLPAATH